MKKLIDLVDDSEVDILFRLLLKFVPEDKLFPDEIEAIERALGLIPEKRIRKGSFFDYIYMSIDITC
ncbi:MAG: hypothetical protein PHD70_06655 [Anaerostipes sp.]|nr:hypothetical protein [Anaerostipes sp.]